MCLSTGPEDTCRSEYISPAARLEEDSVIANEHNGTRATKVKVAGTLRVPWPENSGISDTGCGTWNVPAVFVTCVNVKVGGYVFTEASSTHRNDGLSLAQLRSRRAVLRFTSCRNSTHNLNTIPPHRTLKPMPKKSNTPVESLPRTKQQPNPKIFFRLSC